MEDRINVRFVRDERSGFDYLFSAVYDGKMWCLNQHSFLLELFLLTRTNCFTGHGGFQASDYASNYLHQNVTVLA